MNPGVPGAGVYGTTGPPSCSADGSVVWLGLSRLAGCLPFRLATAPIGPPTPKPAANELISRLTDSGDVKSCSDIPSNNAS